MHIKVCVSKEHFFLQASLSIHCVLFVGIKNWIYKISNLQSFVLNILFASKWLGFQFWLVSLLSKKVVNILSKRKADRTVIIHQFSGSQNDWLRRAAASSEKDCKGNFTRKGISPQEEGQRIVRGILFKR